MRVGPRATVGEKWNTRDLPQPGDRQFSIDISNRPYTARGGARILWSCRDQEIVIEGPAGTGKTRAALEKAHYCAMKYPGSRILLCRKTRESMTQTALVTFEEKVVPPTSPVLVGPQRSLRQSYKYPNGSEIVVGGLDKSARVMSSEYDIIIVFEATEITLDDYESLTSRLRNGKMPYQQIVIDCNPGAPQHWINTRAKRGAITRILSRHKDNPLYFDNCGHATLMGERYLDRLGRLTGHRLQRLLYGLWASAEGVVYENFSYAAHVIPSFKIPKEWRKIRTIDFGYTNPFVCQWWAIDLENVMYLYREIYMSRILVSQHAEVINRWSQGEEYEVTLADWDAEDRATLEHSKIYTQPAFKDITPGLQAVTMRLSHDPDIGRKPRIFFFQDCTIELDVVARETGLPISTIGEFDGYIYPPKKDRQTKHIDEEPVDKDNHGMDAMRYGVAYVDNLQSMQIEVRAESTGVVYDDANPNYSSEPIEV